MNRPRRLDVKRRRRASRDTADQDKDKEAWRRSPAGRLATARAQLAAFRSLVRLMGTAPPTPVPLPAGDGLRFTHLCAGQAGRGSIIYALDPGGAVWQWNYKTEVWVPVRMTRGTASPAVAVTTEAAAP